MDGQIRNRLLSHSIRMTGLGMNHIFGFGPFGVPKVFSVVLASRLCLVDWHATQIGFGSRRKGWLCTVTLIQSWSGFKTGSSGCIRVQLVLVFYSCRLPLYIVLIMSIAYLGHQIYTLLQLLFRHHPILY